MSGAVLATVTPAASALRASGRDPFHRPAPPGTFAETLTVVAALGDRFDLETGWDALGPDRIVASEITDDDIDRGVSLRGAGLGTSDPKVAANLWFQWYCYRMAAPLLGAWVLHRRAPDMAAANIAFSFDAYGRPARAAMCEVRVYGRAGDAMGDTPVIATADLEAEIVRTLVERHLLPLGQRVRDRYRLPKVLTPGTIVAQLGLVLAAIDAASATPWEQVAADAISLLRRMAPMRDGQGALGDVICIRSGDRTGVTFRRKTCCMTRETGDGSPCDSCPRRSDEERAAIYAERLAERPAWTLLG